MKTHLLVIRDFLCIISFALLLFGITYGAKIVLEMHGINAEKVGGIFLLFLMGLAMYLALYSIRSDNEEDNKL